MPSQFYLQFFPFCTKTFIQKLQNLQEMQPKYNSRKFHRSPRIQGQSPQALPINSILTSKDHMSPIPRNHSDSYDEGYQYEQYQTTMQPSLSSIVERLTQLQITVRQDKSQRLDQHTKLVKMIKQMECKHTSIIYDTEIRYSKFGLRPELVGATNLRETRNQGEKSIKKVSSYVFEKNFSQGKNQQTSSNVKNLKKSDAEIGRKMENFDQSTKTHSYVNQNPERKQGYSFEQKTTGSYSFQQSQKQLFVLQAKIQQEFNKKIQKIQQEITGTMNKKVSQLKESLKQSQSKLNSKISSSFPKQPNMSPISPTLQQNFATYKQSTNEQISKHSAEIFKHSNDLAKMSVQLGKIFGQLTKQSQAFSSIYSELTQHSNQLSLNSNQLSNLSHQLIRQSQQLVKQENDFILHFSQNRDSNDVSGQIQKIYSELSALSYEVKSNARSDASQIQYKIQNMYTLIHDLSNPLRERLMQVDQILDQHSQQIGSIRKASQNSSSNITQRINQMENYYMLKIQENQRKISNINQQQIKLSCEFDTQRNKRINQEIQLTKKKQEEQKKTEQKLNNQINSKLEQIRITLLKQLQSYNKIVSDQVVGVIQKHIEYIENYLKNIEEKQSVLYNKFINSTSENQPKVNPRISGGIKLTGNEKFIQSNFSSIGKNGDEGGVRKYSQNQLVMN